MKVTVALDDFSLEIHRDSITGIIALTETEKQRSLILLPVFCPWILHFALGK
jgi:hypothetical protein